MKTFTSIILPVLLATLWVSISEFVRNQLLFLSYWVEHYRNSGMEFPTAPVNGAMWGIWSLCFSVAIFILSKKFSFLQTVLLSWFVGFVFMWIVIGNLGVLPFKLLIPAIPLSLLEVFLATFIIKKLS